MEPRLAEVTIHPDGRVQLCPPQFAAGIEALTADLDRDWPEFVLIGRRALRSNNSWMHNLPDLVGGSNRCTLQLNPDDAAGLGITDGEPVTVTSAAGSVTAPAEVVPALRRGVVSLPHGWGHEAPGTRMKVATSVAGVSANTLTDDRIVDPLSGTAVFNGVPVTVAPAS
jgi:anaerobic selenocysteine-containing dehydrogenase